MSWLLLLLLAMPAASQEAPDGAPLEVSTAALTAGASAQAAVAKSTEPVNPYAVVFAPKTTRDPFFSVDERIELERIEAERRAKELEQLNKIEEARRARLEALRKARMGRAVGKVRGDPCKKLELQGIIQTPNGDAVILNGEVRYAGDKFRVPGIRGLVTLRTIEPTTVDLRAGGRRCRKRIQ